MSDEDFDLEAYCIADTFESQVYEWYKNQRLVGNATLLLAEKWGNRKHYIEKAFKDLNEVAKMIREGKKKEALSWIDGVLLEEAKEQVTDDIYEYLRG